MTVMIIVRGAARLAAAVLITVSDIKRAEAKFFNATFRHYHAVRELLFYEDNGKWDI
jgi:hypothetical protein